MNARIDERGAEPHRRRHAGEHARREDREGIAIPRFNESAGGQVVFCLHVHVIPRKAGEPMKPPASVKEEPAMLSDQALRLAAALKS